jgi:hypothetical protein
MVDRDAYLRSLIDAVDAVIRAQLPPPEPHYLVPVQAPLDPAEEHVRLVLESRRRNNASGQRGEDAENIRAAYGVSGSGASTCGKAESSPTERGRN